VGVFLFRWLGHIRSPPQPACVVWRATHLFLRHTSSIHHLHHWLLLSGRGPHPPHACHPSTAAPGGPSWWLHIVWERPPWSLPVAWAPPSLRPAAPAPLSGPSWQLREHQQVHLSQNGCLPISRPMGAFHIGHAACCRVGVTSTGASTGTESWWLVPRRRPDISAQVRSCVRLSMPRIACHRRHSSLRFRLARCFCAPPTSR